MMVKQPLFVIDVGFTVVNVSYISLSKEFCMLFQTSVHHFPHLVLLANTRSLKLWPICIYGISYLALHNFFLMDQCRD